MESNNGPDQANDSDKCLSVDKVSLISHKAGMHDVDLTRVNQIIEQVTRGSKFQSHRDRVQNRVVARIEALRRRQTSLTDQQLCRSALEADRLMDSYEGGRNVHRFVVHFDMDAFFASVEMRDRPELRDVPMAVGSYSMLSTSNYTARRFGVRAAMPGFVARKLCPQLLIVAPNFGKYADASQRVREVMARNSIEITMTSLDEGYADITDLVQRRYIGLGASADPTDTEDTEDSVCQSLVQSVRRQIYERTGVTVSAGIACNTSLAKLCADINKPDGQFLLPRSEQRILEFLGDKPVRQISGIGPVTAHVLNAFNVTTCGDILRQRALLHSLFSQSAFSFLLRSGLGLSLDEVQHVSHTTPSGDELISKQVRATAAEIDTPQQQQSISCEETFSMDGGDLCRRRHVLQQQCDRLSRQMALGGWRGRLLVVKVKFDTFATRSRCRRLAAPTNCARVMFAHAWRVLKQKLAPVACRLRLIGVRMLLLTRSQVAPPVLPDIVASVPRAPATCPVCGARLHSDARAINEHLDECLSRHGVVECPRDVACVGATTTTNREVGLYVDHGNRC